MPTETLLLNGFSILNDPNVNTNGSGGGELMIHDGSAVFEDDDIVAIVVDNVDANGVLTNDSVVTQIIVYDNAADYYNNTPLYTYDYIGSGDGVDIPNGRSGMGDRYLNFDADDLVSADPGAPVLEELVMVAGVDLVDLVEAGVNPIEFDTFEDIDYNSDGTIDPNEESDGFFSSELNDWIPICFARGTLIETPDGPRFIETLQVGDAVNTLDNGPQEIRWIGSKKTSGLGKRAPIRIKAGALGNVRDLWVSQNHRMLLRGAQAELMFGQSEVLVAAKHLVNDSTIRPDPCPEIEYLHFLFDDHEIVFAECCPAESLLLGDQTMCSLDDTEQDEIIALFPELQSTDDPAQPARLSLKAYEAYALQAS